MGSMDRMNHASWLAVAIAMAVSFLAISIVYPGMVLGLEIPTTTEGLAISDLLDQNVPLRVWGGLSLAHGRLPLWYPGCYGGLPLASIPEAVPYYPLSAIFYAGLSPQAATAATIVLHLLLAGVGTALLARHWGASLSGQIMAAVLMSVGLHLPAHMRQLNVMQSEAWIPWAWLFWDRLIIRPTRREAAGLAFSMGMLGLAGHIEVLHHAMVMMAAWGAIRIVGLSTDWRSARFWTARLAWLVAAALIGAAVAAPHLGPIFEMSRWSERAGTMRYEPTLRSLLMPFAPFILGDPARGGAQALYFFNNFAWEQMIYIGRIPLAMGGVYILVSGWRRRLCRGLFALAALSLMLTYASRLGPAGAVAGMIPMESESRFPHRYLWYFNGVLVISAAFGFDGAIRFLNERFSYFTRPVRIAFVSCIIMSVVVDLARVTQRLNPTDDGASWLRRPDSLVVLENSGVSPNAFAERLSSYGFFNIANAADGLRLAAGPDRDVDAELRRFFPGEQPSLWNWQVVRGYIGMSPWWSALVFGDQHTYGMVTQFDMRPDEDSNLVSNMERFVAWNGFFGSRWFASPFELVSPHLRLIRRLPGLFAETYLYENLAWAGPAWIARDLKRSDSNRQISEEMFASAPDPQCVRMVEADAARNASVAASGALAGDRVDKPDWPDPQHVSIRCRLARPGFLILNQNYHPRWRVSVDGAELHDVLRVNMCQTAVWVGAGEHRVSFEYRGIFERVCLAIGLAGMVAAALCACIPPRRVQSALADRPHVLTM